jgi:hypothetical protein
MDFSSAGVERLGCRLVCSFADCFGCLVNSLGGSLGADRSGHQNEGGK